MGGHVEGSRPKAVGERVVEGDGRVLTAGKSVRGVLGDATGLGVGEQKLLRQRVHRFERVRAKVVACGEAIACSKTLAVGGQALRRVGDFRSCRREDLLLRMSCDRDYGACRLNQIAFIVTGSSL